MDVLNKVLTWVDHNRYLAMAMVIVAVIVVSMVGCKPITAGLVSGEPVTRPQFEAEATVAQQQLEVQRAAVEKAQTDVEARAAAKAIEVNAQIERLKAQATQEVSADRAGVVQDAAAYNAAVVSFQERLSGGYDDLEAQEAQRVALARLGEQVVQDAVSGTLTPTGMVSMGVTFLGLLGLGVTGDNIRKDRRITTLETKAAAQT